MTDRAAVGTADGSATPKVTPRQPASVRADM
jgi:hypothetical protein